MNTGFLGLGGNLGDPIQAMATALRLLDQRADTEMVAASRLFRTPPWGFLDQPSFVNAAAEIRTRLAPEALLDLCLDVERSLRRVRAQRWGPRTIDIDILVLGTGPFASDRLTLPHPRLHERAFVLVPLLDLRASFQVAGRSVSEWVRDTDASGIEPLGDDREWWREDTSRAERERDG